MVVRTPHDGPRPPRLRPIRLGALAAVDVDALRHGDTDLESVEADGASLDALVWDHRRHLDSSRLTRLRAEGWAARSAVLTDSILDGVDVLSLAAAESEWRGVEIRGSRIGSAELYGASWRSVRLTGCRLGYVNLRDSALTDVAFTDCVIDELDLLRSTATRVSFAGCRIARLDVTGSSLADVDLRGARLADIAEPAGLRGATITPDQLLDLAPAIAAALGIAVG
ncbi:pentapeptide repeat-containing protein [Propionicicella superfundia]|uniref:pentapeptide repeat-containing protein n=1 Tax=Propionicicella superfundia TaxID=348582 RepID=UPI0006844890|nr:pentapeptide repeat-containing protein [Propionicicella superfundia]